VTAPLPTLPDFDAQWDFDRPAETETRFRALLDAAERIANRPYGLELRTQVARALGLQGKFEEALVLLDTVEKELTPDLNRVRVRYLLERGRVFNTASRPERAKPLFLDAWTLARAAHEDNLAVDAAHMVAIVESGKAAESWNLTALEYAGKSRDPKARWWRASLYNNLGWTYHGDGRYKEALAVFRKALKARDEMAQAEPTRIARWTVARCLRSLGRVREALAMQREQVALFEEQRREPGPYVCEEMAECLYALGQKSESREWFAKANAALSRDEWLAKHEATRIARLKLLSAEIIQGTAMTKAESIHFEAEVFELKGHTILRLPEAESAKLPSRGQVAVRGTINRHDLRTVLEPDGCRGHWMRVDAELQKAARIRAGDTATLQLEVAQDWPEPELPGDFATALSTAPERVKDKWEEITPTARWEWIRWINETRNGDTRAVRIEKTISKLNGKHRRPCCFNLAACTDPELSKSGKLMEPAQPK
jgi:tetratricopeptide (TPR) repeat protein